MKRSKFLVLALIIALLPLAYGPSAIVTKAYGSKISKVAVIKFSSNSNLDNLDRALEICQTEYGTLQNVTLYDAHSDFESYINYVSWAYDAGYDMTILDCSDSAFTKKVLNSLYSQINQVYFYLNFYDSNISSLVKDIEKAGKKAIYVDYTAAIAEDVYNYFYQTNMDMNSDLLRITDETKTDELDNAIIAHFENKGWQGVYRLNDIQTFSSLDNLIFWDWWRMRCWCFDPEDSEQIIRNIFSAGISLNSIKGTILLRTNDRNLFNENGIYFYCDLDPNAAALQLNNFLNGGGNVNICLGAEAYFPTYNF